ncbi:hypothetical protein LR48_Vigan11g058400 [Vigna angularis]|uniref:Uncharacterized protein n=1 Tax=Phaseolus angularis TaxID=3914 RepID=A0A0L9VR60_PHAAN|nr:hypothetical protein LR48_Vigan11g058400 [Vigna angularis]
MRGEGSERRYKGKGVARPKKRQRQTPKYVLRVPATLPITATPRPLSVGPSPTLTVYPHPNPTVHPPSTPVVHPSPTSAVQPSPTPAVPPPSTPATNILPPPPPVIITPTPPPVIITPTPPPVITTPTTSPDPTSIPSSSSILPFEIAIPFADLDLVGDGDDGLDLPLHYRPWIEHMVKGL